MDKWQRELQANLLSDYSLHLSLTGTINVHKKRHWLFPPVFRILPACLFRTSHLRKHLESSTSECPASQPHISQAVNQMRSLLIQVILTSLFSLWWMIRGHWPFLNECNCIKEPWFGVILLQKAYFAMGHCGFYLKINPSEEER